MFGCIKEGSGELIKLTEKEVCGNFNLQIDTEHLGELALGLSFNTEIIKDIWE